MIFATNRMQTDFHAHYAATLAISPTRKQFHIETKDGRGSYQAVLVTPNTYHRTISPGVEMIALLIDPETDEYEAIGGMAAQGEVRPLQLSAFEPLLDRLLELYYGTLSAAAAWELQLDVLRTVHPLPQLKKITDDRILSIIRRIRTELPDRINMKELGRDLDLSEDRLTRIFKENLGIPLRRYLLWVRLLHSVRLLSRGLSVTEVAHAAGFADSAHFTRTFKENFGFVPSLFIGHLKSVEVRDCEADDDR